MATCLAWLKNSKETAGESGRRVTGNVGEGQKWADGSETGKDFGFALSEMKSIEGFITVWYDLKLKLNRGTLADMSGFDFKAVRVETGR